MKKLLTALALLLGMSFAFGQGVRTSHQVNKDYVAYIDDVTYHSDCFANINSLRAITSYRYVGIDNNHNLTILRTVYNVSKGRETEFQQITFALDENNTGEITLLAAVSQKAPTVIRLSVVCDNHKIKVEYIK